MSGWREVIYAQQTVTLEELRAALVRGDHLRIEPLRGSPVQGRFERFGDTDLEVMAQGRNDGSPVVSSVVESGAEPESGQENLPRPSEQ